jgi:hypothetical protein
MKRVLQISACALVLTIASAAGGYNQAHAQKNFFRGLVGGLIAGAVIGSIVRAGQNHCHGQVCHSHGYARAYHYHDAYGNILYQGPQYQSPAPQYAEQYPEAHYDWCFDRYRSYDLPTNSFQPFGNRPRQPCISPYIN